MSVVEKLNLSSIPYRTTYDRTACKTGVVHLGYGAFHRAHQAIYLDDYMEQTGDLNWGIAAVNLRPSEAPEFARSGQVSGGYLVKTTDTDGSVNMRWVRSHTQYIDWTSNTAAAEQLLTLCHVHLVTITVTESGYYLTSDGNLDYGAPVIADELDGAPPASVYGYLANSLGRRMAQLDQPISILCCDNIRSNGRMLRRNFLDYLSANGQHDIAQWVCSKASFPCSMVDRITPHATPELRSEIITEPGLPDADPIHAETFSQWVLEDNFAQPVPDLRKVGVEVVNDVSPFEEAKIRILNGGHTGLAYLGALAGCRTFDEAMHNPVLRKHFDGFEQLEVLPGLTSELPFSKQGYLEEITTRLCNRAIADQLERICMDGYAKMQIYIRPTLASCLVQGIEPYHCYDCIASWYVYARRYKHGIMPITYYEPYWGELSPLLDAGCEAEFAGCTQLWADLPARFAGFVCAIVQSIQRMESRWPA